MDIQSTAAINHSFQYANVDGPRWIVLSSLLAPNIWAVVSPGRLALSCVPRTCIAYDRSVTFAAERKPTLRSYRLTHLPSSIRGAYPPHLAVNVTLLVIEKIYFDLVKASASIGLSQLETCLRWLTNQAYEMIWGTDSDTDVYEEENWNLLQIFYTTVGSGLNPHVDWDSTRIVASGVSWKGSMNIASTGGAHENQGGEQILFLIAVWFRPSRSHRPWEFYLRKRYRRNSSNVVLRRRQVIYTSNRGLLCSRVWGERPIHRRLVCRTAVCFGPPCGRSFSTVLAVGQHAGFYFKLLHQQPGAFLHLPPSIWSAEGNFPFSSLAYTISSTSSPSQDMGGGSVFLFFLVFHLFSSATACGGCVHQATAAHFTSFSALSGISQHYKLCFFTSVLQKQKQLS